MKNARPGRNNIDNLANYAGPCDYNERNLKERVTFRDYLRIGALMGSLPFFVTVFATCDQLRFKFHKWARDSRYRGAKRSLYDSALDIASDMFATRLNWTQLRIILPVKPIREELKYANYRGLEHYNYYFGGKDYSARWLHEVPNRGPDDPVILYMHGGSYAIKTQRIQLSYMADITKEFAKYRVSTLILDYTIGVCRKWPAQLDEGMACFRDLAKTSKNIIAFGDSCGGHLALAMLLSGASFSACVLVSPTTDLTGDSHDEQTMRESFIDTTTTDLRDPLVSPVFAQKSAWQKCLPKMTAMVWGSEEECAKQMREFVDAADLNIYFEEIQAGHDCILRGRGNCGSVFIEDVIHKWFSLSEEPKLGGTITVVK